MEPPDGATEHRKSINVAMSFQSGYEFLLTNIVHGCSWHPKRINVFPVGNSLTEAFFVCRRSRDTSSGGLLFPEKSYMKNNGMN